MTGPTHLDFFCGFGGSSTGLLEAGYELVTAYNHWDKALEVHAANHQHADHVQGDLSGYDMRRLPKADVLWASPECTWHSPAGGRRRPKAQQLALFGDEPVSPDAAVRSRATMFDPIRAAEARDFKAVLIENVAEVASWPLFNSWLRMWESLDYEWQIVNASAAHIYGPGNAPAGQWRDRLYIVLTKRGVRLPDLSPSPPAWCPQCDAVVSTRQHWKKNYPEGAPQVGKYRQQYVYVCDAGTHALQVVEPYVLPASAVIDWSDLGTRIGDRARPLAAKTMRRIEVGLRMFARPIVTAHSGQTWDAADPRHPGYGDPGSYWRVWAADAAPLMTRQAGGTGDAVAVPPHLIAVNHDGDPRARLLDAPLPTRSTKIGEGLVFPPVVTMNRAENRGTSVDDALATMTTGNNHALTVPPFLAEFYGTGTAAPVGAPVGAMSTSHHHGLAVPPGAFLSRQFGSRGSDGAGRHLNTSIDEPTHPITASGGGNHALVVPEARRPSEMFEGDLPFELDDVRFRMLGPDEHLRAQRFPDDYDTSAANKTDTTKGAGNAVPVNVAHWVGARVREVL